ncbi:hypothetical protein MRX96_031350 [Rhipicephalus microplus]
MVPAAEHDFPDGTPANSGSSFSTGEVVNLADVQRGHPIDEETKNGKYELCGVPCNVPLDATWCILLLLLVSLVIVTIISIYAAKHPTHDSQALVADPDVAAACGDDSARCHNITLYLMDSLNSLVDPCSDFHENVCGWWKAKVAHRGSYQDFHVRFFNYRVARELAAMADPFISGSGPTPASLENQMATFFASCAIVSAGFDRGGNRAELLKTFGIAVWEWTNADNFGRFLELVVTKTLSTGLPSFLKAHFFKGEGFRLDLGETLGSTFSYRQREARKNVLVMLDDFLDELTLARVNYSEISALDDVVQNLTVGRNELHWSLLKGQEELNSIAEDVDWMKALERGLPAKLKNEPIKDGLEVHGVSAFRDLIERLRVEPLPRVGEYSLVVLLAQVTKYVPPLGYEDDSNAETFVAKCLHLTASLFDRLYPVWVAKTFQHTEQVSGARYLFDDIVSTLRKEPVVNQGLMIDTRRLNKARLVTYDEVDNDSLPMAPLDATLGGSFLFNLAQVAAARVGEKPAAVEFLEYQLKGHVGYTGDRNFLISSAYLSNVGVYVTVTTDPEMTTYLRYATLGTLILRSIFDSDATKYFPNWAQEYIKECFAQSASSVLDQPVSTRLATAVMRFRWSAQLSWFLKSRRLGENDNVTNDENSEKLDSATTPQSGTSVFKKLFFRIVCFTVCGDTDARELCDDLAGFDRHFARVFHCPKKTATRNGECTCPGFNRCRTYLPVCNDHSSKTRFAH